ncbi:hypothetical protein SDC9_52059 [bioreactor metagenome]|uniref:Type II secretion system protein GspF domain-containing protein n=1 Tax=bioreactor metagenome TaxID=1076179 RepID=A0A644WUM5_9ZZZZ
MILFISMVVGVFIYSMMMMTLPSNNKFMMKVRYLKYFKDVDVDEVQDQVLKEKNENARKKKSFKFQFISKEFSNYLVSSGVKLSATEYICLWMLTTFVPMYIALLLSKSMITATGVAIIGFFAPPIFVRRSRKKRQEEFSKQLGESLTVMGNCIKAGFSFQQSMESIAADMQPPISTEFGKTLREIHFGISMEDALKHMVDRVKNQDFDLLVSAVLTSTQVGSNLSDILEVISDTVKDRIKIKSEVRVLTASGRTSGLIIGFLPIIIIIALMLLNPGYLNAFFETGAGRIMLIISAVLETMGFMIINKIVDIKY